MRAMLLSGSSVMPRALRSMNVYVVDHWACLVANMLLNRDCQGIGEFSTPHPRLNSVDICHNGRAIFI
jgi:hypothetical protein